ncbi:g10705 [Coccomyxa viridis]|uniref:G10705 protein n=1 Tax=Coccomyxa viridis TaxID=1274662 RepID=A0ABP1G6G0_9CHLO
MAADREEQLLLRVQDADLAERLHAVLSERPGAPKDPTVELRFDEDGEGRKGTFSFDETSFRASLKDLPTIVECYKTYDDVNLVKTGDIGQVILVGGKQNASIKARNGLTPPMRDAARRMFDQNTAVDQKLMQKLEDDLLAIAQGKAPAGMEFVDVEEQYVVDEAGYGSWQPVTDSTPVAPAQPPPRKKPKKAKSSQEAPAPEPEEGPEADMEEI